MQFNRPSDTTRRAAAEPVALAPNDGSQPANSGAEDLPRFCLELDPAESKRTLAWVNSICLAFLVIGIMGLRPPPITIVRRVGPQEEAAPVVIEPLVTAVPTVTPETTPEVNEKPEESPGVAVVLDSPAVAFSVPTVGNVLVPISKAQAPPANPMQGAASLSSPHIEQINVTGVGGSRPAPFYPRESLIAKEEGTVTLLIEVNENGRVDKVTVKESSGYFRLDRAATDHVRKVWFFAPGQGKRVYECPITFQIQ